MQVQVEPVAAVVLHHIRVYDAEMAAVFLAVALQIFPLLAL